MGVRLIVEVLDCSPPELTVAERLLLIALAEKADDRSRRVIWSKADGDRRALLARRVGVTENTLRALLGKLGSRGYETRVPTGTDARGRPVFAFLGHLTDYVVPPMPATESRDPGLTSERCDESLTSPPKVRLSCLGGETTVAPPEPERCDEDLALVPSFPSESDDVRAPEGVAALLARFGASLSESDATAAVAAVVAKYDPADPARYMASWPLEDITSWARRGQRDSKAARNVTSKGPAKCRHHVVGGLRILGHGAQASRLCGACDVEMPATEAELLAQQLDDGRPKASGRRNDIDWEAAAARAVARDAAAEAAS